MDQSKKQLVFSILEFLKTCTEDGTVKSDAIESLEVATQCISETFEVDITNEEQKKELSIKPASLQQIFNVFLKTQKKSQTSKPESTSTATFKPITEEDKKKAEEFKSQGNVKVTEKNYKEAVKFYSQAIDLVDTNAVYYANRAAAYSQLNDQDNAIKDSLKSAELDPKYAKAYSRLGHAYYCKEEFAKAVEAFEKATELEPNNANFKSALQNCIQRNSAGSKSVAESSRSPTSPPAFPGAGAGGLPGADALGGMDFASLMSNPMIRNMANQLMQSGAMNDMMRDPSKMAEMAQQFMGGANGGAGAGAGGDNPLASMMNNPEMARLAQQFAANGGLNGGLNGGANPSPSPEKE